MRRFRHLLPSTNVGLALAGSTLVAFTSLIACSDSESSPTDVSDAGQHEVDSSSDPDVADASITDANDAGEDAEAGERLCSDQGWCHAYAPTDQNLEAVWGDGKGVVWAVSREGNILRYADDVAGISGWSIVFTDSPGDGGSPRPLHTIWGSSPTDIWVGGNGGLFHGQGTSSASLTWTRVPVDNDIPITSLWGTAESDVWAVGWSPSKQVYFPSIPCTFYGEEGPYESPCNGYDFQTTALHFGGAASGWTKVDVPSPEGRGPVALRQVTGVAHDDVWLGAVYNSFCTDDCEGSAYGGAVFRGRPDDSGTFQWVEEHYYGGQFRGGFAGSQVDAIGATGTSAIFLSGQIGADDFYEQYASAADGVTFPLLVKGTFGTGSVRRSFYDWGVWSNFAVSGTSASDVYVAGVMGRFRHWDGTTWSTVGLATDGFPILDDLHGIWSSTKDIWVVGDRGIAIRKNTQTP